MKTLILTTGFVIALSQVSNVSTASAIFGIPGTPSVPGDPLDAARALERALKCKQIRDDADQHQTELRQAEANAVANLNTANEEVSSRTSSKNKLITVQAGLKQQENILADFQSIGFGLSSSENELKNSIYSIHTRAADPELDQTLSEMEAQTENLSLRQLASLVRTLMQKNSKDLKSMLENKNSKLLLMQVSALISNSQITIQKLQATNDAMYSENESKLSEWTTNQANIAAQINTIRGEYNSQEERKSCNF
jgi:hypothetical protein